MFASTLFASAGLLASVSASPALFSRWSSQDLFRRALSTSCGTDGAASCTNSSRVADLCCFEAPSGLLLQVQFWDTDPPTGPSDSWTIHGLFPDRCSGGFDSNCDPSREYTDIAGLLRDQGASDTLDFMNTFWKNLGGNDEELWEHEWAKHGTCLSTLDVTCLPDGSPTGAEAVAFFNTVVKLFKELPTFKWLADAGITPSETETHTLDSLTSALEVGFGFTPELDCKKGELFQVSYYHNLQGSIIDGKFVAIDTPKAGSCPKTGIKYLPKAGSPEPSKTATKTSTKSSTQTQTTGATGVPTKATIQAVQDGSEVGALLSKGTFSSQTPATFTLSGNADSLKLSSSKGTCGVSGGIFGCGNGESTTFSAVTSGDLLLLAFDGRTQFSSDSLPTGSKASDVLTSNSGDQAYTLSIVST